MDQQTLSNIIYVAIFFLTSIVIAVGATIVPKLLAPTSHTRNVDGKTDQFIECGMKPIGSAWIRFGIIYYMYALIFLAFDVDVLFLFPVAATYNTGGLENGIRDFVEVVIFVGILSLAVIYAWVKGVFKWERRKYHHQ
ncbi:MAG: NADH-quinone oxidoreductase subunit A [Desulfobulbaceae bacterium]|nr:NADH-quinone oxidoreductase subunit A [Desulfobulbaceae bacterium]